MVCQASLSFSINEKYQTWIRGQCNLESPRLENNIHKHLKTSNVLEPTNHTRAPPEMTAKGKTKGHGNKGIVIQIQVWGRCRYECRSMFVCMWERERESLSVWQREGAHDICISLAALVLAAPHLYVHTEWVQVMHMAKRSRQKGQILKWSQHKCTCARAFCLTCLWYKHIWTKFMRSCTLRYELG